MNAETKTLDVREDICSGRSPFDKIQNALTNVRPGECLRLLAPFEPVPLFSVAAAMGLGHQATQLPGGDWEVLFSPAFPTVLQPVLKTSSAESGNPDQQHDEIIDVDARGLEPPQPMVRILDTLAGLPQGAKLRARTDRRPVHLYPHLEDRGFIGESEEQKDGSFITYIRRA